MIQFLVLESLLVLLFLNSCTGPTSGDDSTFLSEAVASGREVFSEDPLLEHHPIICMRPGLPRKSGKFVSLGPRRPLQTSAFRCRELGGTYSPLTLKAVLDIWMPKAEDGDAEAQTIVGQAYESLMGTAPDYMKAASWYRSATNQGYNPARLRLGWLYEHGLGVKKSISTARTLFTEAGREDGFQIFPPSGLMNEKKQLARKQDALKHQLDQIDEKIKELEDDKSLLINDPDRLAGHQGRILTLEGTKDALIEEAVQVMERRRTIAQQEWDKFKKIKTDQGSGRDLDFGEYYALVIGISHYKYAQQFGELPNAAEDARAIYALLKEKYQFNQGLPDSATLLMNERATKKQIAKRLAVLAKAVSKSTNANLLIYFSGHGILSGNEPHQRGYWVPYDGQERFGQEGTLFSNDELSSVISKVAAKQVFVIADSCYAGSISGLAAQGLSSKGNTPAEKIRWLETVKDQTDVRMVLTSGGEEPVYDNLGGAHSVFAEALLEVLGKEKHGVVSSGEVWTGVQAYMWISMFPKDVEGLVRSISRDDFHRMSFPNPRYGFLFAGLPATGQFFFVPTS